MRAFQKQTAVRTNTAEINTSMYVLVWPYVLKQYLLYINIKPK